MTEIQFYDEELADVESEISKAIEGLGKLKHHEKPDKLYQIENRLEQARRMFHRFKVEIRDLPPMEKRTYEQRATEHQSTLNQLSSDLQWAKSESQRTDLLGADAGKGGNRVVSDPSQMNAAQLAEASLALQDDGLESLARSRRVVNQTEETATATGEKLKQQTEQLGNISDGIDRIESNLKRADREIRAFVRRMATDKIIMAFLCLIVVGILIAVILRISKGKKGSKDSS